MSVEMIGRLLGRAKDLGLSPRAASLKAGLGPTAVRDIVQRPGASPRVETIRKLAEALGTTPEWLSYGIDGDGELELGTAATPLKQSSNDDFVEAEHGGTLQAGSFREVDDIEDPDREPEIVPRDKRFPREKYVVFDVAGDSMNAADPPIPDGCQVLIVAADNPYRPIALRNGDLVAVQRKKAQGGLIERSVKEIEMREVETIYHPRSTNKRHQPIIVPNIPDPEDETTVEVLGLVISVIAKVRRR